jgi:hypothetical protein
MDASIRGVLVSQIAISVGHASIGQVERASPDPFDEAGLSPTGTLDSMSTSSRAMESSSPYRVCVITQPMIDRLNDEVRSRTFGRL